MGIREEILDRVRRNAPPTVEKPVVPDFCRLGPSDLIPAFRQSLEIMAGTLVERPPQDFAEFLRKQFPHANNICSTVPEYTGSTRPESYLTKWSDAAGIDVSIVRSPMGVAETGSVLLSEMDLQVNTIAFLAHDIVILLDPKRIVENVH